MDEMKDAYARDANEETDKRNMETGENEEGTPITKEAALSEYQKKMKELRAKRFGVDGKIEGL